jgi:hypothetical protein
MAVAGLLQPACGANKATYPEINIRTLASAKVQLCKGFAENTVDYYMRTQMPREWAAYTRANEFEASQKQALHELALQRMNQEAAKNFDAATIYQASNRSAYLSEYKRVPDGFEAALPSGVTLHTTYFTHADGHREVIDIPSLYGLKDVLDHEMPAWCKVHRRCRSSRFGMRGCHRIANDGDKRVILLLNILSQEQRVSFPLESVRKERRSSVASAGVGAAGFG